MDEKMRKGNPKVNTNLNTRESTSWTLFFPYSKDSPIVGKNKANRVEDR